MLAAGAGGAVGIDLQILGTDDDVDGVVDLGRDEDAGEGRMPPLGLVEGRDADEAMHTDLARQHAVGVGSVHRKGGGLDACLFGGLVVVEFRLESLALGPAQVHAHEHLGPVLRFGAAGAGMDGDDGVARVVLAGEQRLGLELFDQRLQRVDLFLQFRLDLLAFFREFEVGGDVPGAALELCLGRER